MNVSVTQWLPKIAAISTGSQPVSSVRFVVVVVVVLCLCVYSRGSKRKRGPAVRFKFRNNQVFILWVCGGIKVFKKGRGQKMEAKLSSKLLLKEGTCVRVCAHT